MNPPKERLLTSSSGISQISSTGSPSNEVPRRKMFNQKTTAAEAQPPPPVEPLQGRTTSKKNSVVGKYLQQQTQFEVEQ